MAARRRKVAGGEGSGQDNGGGVEWAEDLVLPPEDWSKIYLAPGEPDNHNPTNVKLDLVDGVQVFFSFSAWRFLWYCVDRAGDYEVSGLGEVQVVGPGCLYVPRVFLLKQLCSETETSPDMEAVAAFHMDWLEDQEKGKDGVLDADGVKPETFLGLWWHSHGKLAPFFSTVDHSTIQRIEGEPLMLSLVVNKERKYQARVDVFKPVRAAVLAEVSPDFRIPGAEREAFAVEFDAKYRRKPPVSSAVTTSKGHFSYGGGGQSTGAVGTPTPSSYPTMLDRGQPHDVGEAAAGYGWVRPQRTWDVSAMVSWYVSKHHLPMPRAKRAALIRKAIDTLSPTVFIEEGQLVAAINGNLPKDMPKAILDVLASIPESSVDDAVASTNGAGEKQGVVLSED